MSYEWLTDCSGFNDPSTPGPLQANLHVGGLLHQSFHLRGDRWSVTPPTIKCTQRGPLLHVYTERVFLLFQTDDECFQFSKWLLTRLVFKTFRFTLTVKPAIKTFNPTNVLLNTFPQNACEIHFTKSFIFPSFALFLYFLPFRLRDTFTYCLLEKDFFISFMFWFLIMNFHDRQTEMSIGFVYFFSIKCTHSVSRAVW